jgi:hypothetical protein
VTGSRATIPHAPFHSSSKCAKPAIACRDARSLPAGAAIQSAKRASQGTWQLSDILCGDSRCSNCHPHPPRRARLRRPTFLRLLANHAVDSLAAVQVCCQVERQFVHARDGISAELCARMTAPGLGQRNYGTPRKLADTSRLKALGWNSARNIEEGVRTTYAAALEAGVLN